MATRVISYDGTRNVYAVIRSGPDAWKPSTSTIVAYDDSDVDSFDIPLVNIGGDLFELTIPDALPASSAYQFMYYDRAGSTPTNTDDGITIENVGWSGSVVYTPLPTPYVTAQDMIDAYGNTLMTLLSQANKDVKTPDNGKIERAIGEAARDLHTRLQPTKYSTPLTGMDAETADLIRDLVKRMALLKLYMNKPGTYFDTNGRPFNPAGDTERFVQRVLSRVIVGTIKLVADRKSGAYPSAVVQSS